LAHGTSTNAQYEVSVGCKLLHSSTLLLYSNSTDWVKRVFERLALRRQGLLLEIGLFNPTYGFDAINGVETSCLVKERSISIFFYRTGGGKRNCHSITSRDGIRCRPWWLRRNTRKRWAEETESDQGKNKGEGGLRDITSGRVIMIWGNSGGKVKEDQKHNNVVE
jgi:hypothetical protein